jgi:hypothetical protein
VSLYELHTGYNQCSIALIEVPTHVVMENRKAIKYFKDASG